MNRGVRVDNKYKRKWYRGVKPQQRMLDGIRDNSEIPFCSVRQNGAREFVSLYAGQIKEILTTKNQGMYEIIRPQVKRKVYFDIDGAECSLETIKNAIREKLPDAIFNISGSVESSKDGKGTYHIVVANYHYNNLVENLQLKDWCKNSDLPFDWKVYTKHRQMKCVNQSKPKREVQKILEGSKNPLEHLITYFPIIGIKSKSACGIFSTIRAIDASIIPQQKLICPRHINDALKTNALELIKMIPNPSRGTKYALPHSVTWIIFGYAMTNGVSMDEFWNWAKTKDDSVERRNNYYTFYHNGNYVDVKTKAIIKILERFYPNISKPRHTRNFIESFNIPITKYTERWLEYSDFTNRKVQLLTHGMGGNKTGAVVDYLNIDENASILFITSRRSLARNVSGRLSNFDIYLTMGGDRKKKTEEINKSKKLVLGVCSLNYINSDNLNWDIVVIDEIESVLSMWLSDVTHGNMLNRNWINFKQILKKCNKLLLMDAFTTTKTINFLHNLGITDIEILGRQPIAAEKTVTEIRVKREPKKGMKSKSDALDDLFSLLSRAGESVANGKKVYLFYPYKSGGSYPSIEVVRKMVGKSLSDDEVCIYHGDSSDSIITSLVDVNDIWGDENVRLVITNSVITIGVNYDRKDFHEAYLIYPYWLPPRDLIQTSARIRHLIDGNIYYVTLPSRSINTFEVPIESNNCSVYKALIDDLLIEHKSKNSTVVKHMFGLAGYDFDLQYVEDEINRELIEECIREVPLYWSWDNIDTITDGDFVELQKKCYNSTATQDDKLMMQKHRFIEMFNFAPEDTLRTLWDEKQVFFCFKYREMLEDKDHVFWKIMNHYNVSDLDDTITFSEDERIPYELYTEINKRFRLSVDPDTSDKIIISRMLNTYYGRTCFACEKDAKGKYHWVWDTEYLGQIEFCKQYIRVRTTVIPDKPEL